jgi:hypothetical protein
MIFDHRLNRRTPAASGYILYSDTDIKTWILNQLNCFSDNFPTPAPSNCQFMSSFLLGSLHSTYKNEHKNWQFEQAGVGKLSEKQFRVYIFRKIIKKIEIFEILFYSKTGHFKLQLSWFVAFWTFLKYLWDEKNYRKHPQVGFFCFFF